MSTTLFQSQLLIFKFLGNGSTYVLALNVPGTTNQFPCFYKDFVVIVSSKKCTDQEKDLYSFVLQKFRCRLRCMFQTQSLKKHPPRFFEVRAYSNNTHFLIKSIHYVNFKYNGHPNRLISIDILPHHYNLSILSCWLYFVYSIRI